MTDKPQTPFKPHPNVPQAARQIDTAIRRNGELLLGNDTMQALLAAGMAVPKLIVDASVDDQGADALMDFFILVTREYVEFQKQQRAGTMALVKPQGSA